MTSRIRILSWLAAILVTVPMIAAAQGYRIGPGDILQIEVIEDETLNRSVLVDPQGRINFPLAGSILVRGKTVGAVQSTLVARLLSNFAAPPTVYVALEQVAPEEEPAEPKLISIFVLGEVGSPGKVEMEPGSTLIQAFAEMGGVSEFAATKRVQLRRTDHKTGIENVTTLNYQAMLRGASTGATIRLHDGDVILVPTRRLFE
jgi:polysaccharide biosynthesis/export protein